MARPSSRAAGERGGVPVVVGLVLALLVFPAGPGAASGSSTWAPAGRSPLLSASNGSEAAPALVVQASVPWARTGNVTTFSAAWSAPPAGCSLTPLWDHWSVAAGPAGGTLSGSGGPSTNFTGATADDGPAVVEVQGVAADRCGNETTSVVATANGSVLEVAPLSLGALSVGPGPLSLGGTASLGETIVGGAAPFEVAVDWGDGSSGSYELASGGPFDLDHVYPTQGEYTVRVEVADSSGQQANATAAQPLQVSNDPELEIVPSAPVGEVGVPIRLVGVTVHPPSSFNDTRLTACNESASTGPSFPTLTCDPTRPGSLTAALVAAPGFIPRPPAQLFQEAVVPALSVTASAAGPAEVGAPAAVAVRLSGGVPPFVVAWSFGGFAQPAPAPIPEDGSFPLRVTPNATGFAGVVLRVTDADGAVRLLLNVSVYVAPALDVQVSASAAPPQPPLAEVDLAATTSGGAPPYDWAILASTPFGASSEAGGWVPGPGPLTWTGAFPSEGWGSVGILVADAAGGLAAGSVPVAFLPTLLLAFSATLRTGPEGEVLSVNWSATGGAPPFAAWVNASSGTGWNGTDPNDGPFSATLPLPDGPNASVVLGVSVVLVDRYGARVLGTTAVAPTGVVATPPAPAAAGSPAPAAGELAGLVGGLLLAGLAVVFWRFRRSKRAEAAPPPDPEKVLEGILAPADGAERVTVELLAEEAGVPLDLVRSTLDRLIAAHRVRSEVTPEGEEVLAWGGAAGA